MDSKLETAFQYTAFAIVVMVAIGGFIIYRHSITRGANLYEIGDCVAHSITIENANDIEHWEKAEPVSYDVITAKGKNAYRTTHTTSYGLVFEHKIRHKDAYVFEKIECPK